MIKVTLTQDELLELLDDFDNTVGDGTADDSRVTRVDFRGDIVVFEIDGDDS